MHAEGEMNNDGSALDRTVSNPVTGESVTFLRTADETDGEYVRVRCDVPAGVQGPPLHYHTAFTESFEVVEGTLYVCIGSKDPIALRPGQKAFAGLGVVHRFWNEGLEPCAFEAEIRPASNFEETIRAGFGLARDGRVNAKGVPKDPMELALIYELSQSYLPGMPLFLQRGLFGIVARIARWRGYDPEFSKYTKPGGLVEGRTSPSGTSLGTLTVLTAMLVFLLLFWRRSHRSGRR